MRTETGKGASRRARREGKIPAVLYGHGADPQHLELPGHDFAAVLRHSGTNAVLTLDIEGKEQLALTKALDIHPIRRTIQHADLLVVRRGEKVVVEVNVGGRGRGRTRHPGHPGDQHHRDRGRGHVDSRAVDGVRRGRRTGHPVHRRADPAAAGVNLISDPELLVVNVVNAPTAEELAEEGAGEVAEGAEPDEEARGPKPRPPGRVRVPDSNVAEPLLVVGLGNPGDNYARTRHNLGFMVADLLAARLGSKFKAHKRSGAEVVSGRLAGHSVVLAKPRCYMNESGRQVGPLAKFYSVSPADIVVIHDDLDLDFGRIRLKIGGGEGGHNGLRSVASALGTKDFQRVRIGIGRPPGRKDPAAFVLENFTAAERAEVPTICEQAADATELLIELGLEPAQNRVHGW